MNETIKLMGERMSLRRYAPEPIKPGHLEAIMHSTTRAPTAGNMMLYSVGQVEDQDKKDRLSETCGHPFIATAPLILLFLADMQRIYDFYPTPQVDLSYRSRMLRILSRGHGEEAKHQV